MRIASRLRCRFRLKGGVYLPEVLAAPSDEDELRLADTPGDVPNVVR
jgi:hypothetical protein